MRQAIHRKRLRSYSPSGADANFKNGTMSLRNMELRQGTGTFITATEGAATGVSENKDNSIWTLKGVVHIEFDGAVLDADNAIAVFANGRLKSVDVKGSPAKFSHQLKNTERSNVGRARNIQYDAATSFAGDTWYSDGVNEASGDTIVYDLRDGSIKSKDRLIFTIKPGQRVPAPRTPDRASAK